jgi:hypothetical protein
MDMVVMRSTCKRTRLRLAIRSPRAPGADEARTPALNRGLGPTAALLCSPLPRAGADGFGTADAAAPGYEHSRSEVADCRDGRGTGGS